MRPVSLRTSVLAVVLVTSVLPLAALAWLDLRALADARAAAEDASWERAALAAALRADGAEDPLVAAASGAPVGATVFVVSPDGAWWTAGRSGRDPGLAAALAGAGGSADVRDPATGDAARVAWGRVAEEAPAVALARTADAPLVARAPAGAAVVTLALGAALVAVVLVRRVAAPLARLGDASRRLAAGEEAEVPEEGVAEVRELAASFNTMARELRRQHELLERYAAQSRSDLDAVEFALAHELREPLRSMRTLADTVLDEPDPDDAVQALAMVRRKSGQLEHVVQELHRYDEVARRPMHTGSVDLRVIAEEAADEVRRAVAPRTLDLDLGDLPRIEGSEQLLLALAREALSNAALHGGGRVRVTASQAGPEVVLAFEDHGPGIPPERRDDAFHLFQQLRPGAPGAGVGLAIVRRVAERHGGSAGIEDTPGGGLRLVVRLPAGGPPTVEPQAAAPARRF